MQRANNNVVTTNLAFDVMVITNTPTVVFIICFRTKFHILFLSQQYGDDVNLSTPGKFNVHRI